MSQESAVRRAVAEIRWDNDASTIAWVGNRAVHHYWTLLSAYFRDVLLPPQRRAEDNGVTWTWREPAGAPPVSATELRVLRKRLADEQKLFAENFALGGLGGNGDASGLHAQVNLEQLGAVMADVVARIIARGDPELTGFVCRTETGLRVHSWGAGVPARPTYPDTDGLEIAGRVLVGGKPARHDVILESGDGETLAETPSDAAGEFRFPKLSPGDYRLRARTMRGTFPTNGLGVVLKHQSVTHVVLSDSNAGTPANFNSPRRGSRRRSRRTALVLAMLALTAIGAGWGWKMSQPSRDEPPNATARLEATADRKNGDQANASADPARASIDAGRSGAGVSAERGRIATEMAAASASTDVQGGAGRFAGDTAGQSAENAQSESSRLPVEGHTSDRNGRRLPDSGLPGPAKGQPLANGVPVAAEKGAPDGSVPGIRAPGSGTSVTASASSASAGVAGSTSPQSSSAKATPPGSTAAATVATSPPPTPSSAAPTLAPAVTPATPKKDSKRSGPAPRDEPSVSASQSFVASLPDPVRKPAPNVTAEKSSKASAAVAAEPLGSTPAATSPEGFGANSVVAARSLGRESHTDRSASSANSDLPSSAPQEPDRRVPFYRGEVRIPPAPLSRTVRVRVSSWRSRVLADTILPTEPLRTSEPETVALLRNRMLAEQEARLPAAFREPDARTGVALVLPAVYPREILTWVDAAGVVLADATVSEGCAEIIWPAASASVEQTFRLRRRDGSVVAEVRIEPNSRDFTIRTTDDIRTWLRLAIRVAPADAERAANREQPAPRFSWRAASGATMPMMCQTGITEADIVEHHVKIPLGSVAGAVSLQGFALLDHDSGWAIVSDVRQAADRPLGQ